MYDIYIYMYDDIWMFLLIDHMVGLPDRRAVLGVRDKSLRFAGSRRQDGKLPVLGGRCFCQAKRPNLLAAMPGGARQQHELLTHQVDKLFCDALTIFQESNIEQYSWDTWIVQSEGVWMVL